jgi:hypothetical protein
MNQIAIAGAALLLITGAPLGAGAQAVGYDGGAEPPHAVDAGTPKPDFYNVSAFADRVEARIGGGAMSSAQKRSAMAELRAIRAQLAERSARKGGELRDWDRELINARLTKLSDRIGGAAV